MDTESQVVDPFVVAGPQARDQGQDAENRQTQVNQPGELVQVVALGGWWDQSQLIS